MLDCCNCCIVADDTESKSRLLCVQVLLTLLTFQASTSEVLLYMYMRGGGGGGIGIRTPLHYSTINVLAMSP